MRSMHKRLGVIAGFLVVLALLAINTAILRHQLAVQVGNQEWFSHSRRVLQELRNTESLVKDAETGQRGYLYTEKSTTSHHTLSPRADRFASEKLGAQIGDNPVSKPRSPISGSDTPEAGRVGTDDLPLSIRERGGGKSAGDV